MSSSDKNSAKEAEAKPVDVDVDDASEGGLDQAWKYLDAHRDADDSAGPIDLTALRRKIDWHIVPLMFLCYTLQFLDKVILNVRGCPIPPSLAPLFLSTGLVPRTETETHAGTLPPHDRRLIWVMMCAVRQCDGPPEGPEDARQ